ncbi:MAG TPA: cytochrome c oxidase assembly factor CtaG [Candidatus Dormibacteraeota bacterium]|nr:cytochrome c oxidase assembly factor CtaG [Candidatus Dormibacteraeota bacterium]
MWLDLQIFGFRALWSPYFFTYILLLALAYFLITGPLRHKFGGQEKPSIKQMTFFYSGLILLYIVKGSPIDLLSHIMLSAHMTQLAVYFLVFPIFIIKGVPVWIWRKVINAPIIKPIYKFFSNPIIALISFNLLFSIYHMPVIFNFSKSSQFVHSSISVIILFTAFMMWWMVLAPIKEHDKLPALVKMGYIFANAALITPACALIIFASNPLFAAYSSEGAWIQAMSLCVPGDVLQGLTPDLSGAEMFSPLSTIDDQQLGGIVMQTLITIIYGTMLGRVFFNWYNRESHKIDPIPAESYEINT